MSQKIQEEILRGKQQTLGNFIWNSKTGQFLGRTGTSWVKIVIFYVIFYAFLAGFFSCMMALFYMTLDTKWLPKYTPGNSDSLLRHPALGIRPQPRPWNLESSLISYSHDHGSYRHWVESLNHFIASSYEGTGDTETSDVTECNEDKPAMYGQVCKFDYQRLGQMCTKAEEWGYPRKAPCVILKMNKMIGWEPDVFETIQEVEFSWMPDDLKEHIKMLSYDNGDQVPKMVWVACDGVNAADKELIGKIEYTPWQGFPSYFFPYMNIPGYLPPIVAVRFVNPAKYVLINIQCWAYAKNINHNKKQRLGLVHFELLLD